ncbi:DeoR/GlpR family DNA-binding transcription regulator [Streptomyces sp. NPDC047108]|uniref:DeoR/GlpR family DNA-binding transcription regulator n=1 Tax=Streptomyces sp. NPDC047108 TaxID=3155025 RepID=UPI0033C36389
MAGRERTSTRNRRRRLVELLGDDATSVRELAAEFGVSLSTIRRDLAVLADRGRITRTYGGAVDPRRAERGGAPGGPDAVAAAAAGLVRGGEVVLLDAGPGVDRLARELRDRTDITVVTNGLPTLFELADASVDVVVLGGTLRRPHAALEGTRTEQALRRISPDLAFLGAEGLDPARGINCPHPEQAALKELMAECARATWVLTDHAGADASFPYWATVPPGTGLVAAGDEEELAAFAEAHWTVRGTGDRDRRAGEGSAAEGGGRLR